MMTQTQEKIEELRETISVDLMDGELRRMNYRLSDAIREGSSVTTQANGWGEGYQACALHAAVIAAEARGHLA